MWRINKPEDMNEGFDEITELFMDAAARKQIELKKKKRNLRILQNARSKLTKFNAVNHCKILLTFADLLLSFERLICFYSGICYSSKANKTISKCTRNPRPK